jgi:hypothetical protein
MNKLKDFDIPFTKVKSLLQIISLNAINTSPILSITNESLKTDKPLPRSTNLLSLHSTVEPLNSHYVTMSGGRKRIGNQTTKARVELAAGRQFERSDWESAKG